MIFSTVAKRINGTQVSTGHFSAHRARANGLMPLFPKPHCQHLPASPRIYFPKNHKSHQCKAHTSRIFLQFYKSLVPLTYPLAFSRIDHSLFHTSLYIPSTKKNNNLQLMNNDSTPTHKSSKNPSHGSILYLSHSSHPSLPSFQKPPNAPHLIIISN